MRWGALEKGNDAVKVSRARQTERIQYQVLKHIEADGNDAGERVHLVPEVVLFGDREGHRGTKGCYRFSLGGGSGCWVLGIRFADDALIVSDLLPLPGSRGYAGSGVWS